MTTTTLDELLHTIDNTPVGPEERALIADAIRVADEAGDELGAYRARLRLTNSAHMSGDTETLLASFAWCVARYEADPVRFPAQLDGHDLLFQYKWMSGRVAANPAFSLEQVAELTDDMARAYRAAGISQSGVLQASMWNAVLAGELDRAEQLKAERDQIPRDEYSHCEACVRASDAYFARLRGDEAESLRLFDEIISEQLSCGEEPESAQGEALLSLLRAGRVDDAVAHHRQAYRAARRLPEGFPLIADHLVFCAVTGNPARGLAILERHIADFAIDPLNVSSLFFQAIAVATLLDEVVRAGEGDTPVRGSDAARLSELLGATEGPRTAADFAEQTWQLAERIAAEFDARNGNDFYARAIIRQRDLRNERYDVPLDSQTYVPVAAPERAEPSDAAGWIVRTRELYTGSLHGAAHAVERGLEIAEPGPERTELLRLAASIARTTQAPDADARVSAYVAALRTAGRELRARAEEELAARELEPSDIEPLLSFAAELPSDGAEPDARARVLALVGDVSLRDGRAEEAASLHREAIDLFSSAELAYPAHELGGPRLRYAVALANSGDEAGADVIIDALADDPHVLAMVRLQAIDIQARRAHANDDVAAALQFADRSLAEWVTTGEREGIVATAEFTAQLLSQADRDAEAAARIRFAIGEAERAEQPTAWLRISLARYELWSRRSSDALEQLEQLAVELAADEGTPRELLATAQFWRGEAAMAEGEPGTAYDAWSQAVAHAGEIDAAALEARAAVRLGELLSEYGDDEAVDAFRAGLEAARRDGDLRLIVSAQHGLGRALAQAGDESALTELDGVHAIAVEQGADWLAADITDSRARALVALDRVDEALPLFEKAVDAFTSLGDIDSALGSRLGAARGLRRFDRAEEAVEHYRRLLATAPEPPLVIETELAALLDELGRSEEAAALRSGTV